MEAIFYVRIKTRTKSLEDKEVLQSEVTQFMLIAILPIHLSWVHFLKQALSTSN